MQKRKRWSLQDEKFLRENYYKGSSVCAKALNCTIAAVDMKAFKLGIRRGTVGRNNLSHEDYEDRLILREIDYFPIEKYVSGNHKILHGCIEGHEWLVTPSNILAGYGCPECSSSGFKATKRAILYYVKIGKYYKIGITNRTVKARFSQDKDKSLVILKEVKYARGYEAQLEEARLFNLYPPVTVPGYLKHGGNSELYDFDVLGLDKQK